MLFALMTSCQTEDVNPELRKSNYLPLEVGNYWVYQHYRIESVGNEFLLEEVDSVVITKDTIIRNERYFVMEGISSSPLWNKTEIVRDSSKHLVNHLGQILFSEINFTDVLYTYYECQNELNDTLLSISYQMENPEMEVTVPAGTFEVLNYKGNLVVIKEELCPEELHNRILNRYYALNIGKILHTYYYVHSSYTFERRLVRYQLVNQDK